MIKTAVILAAGMGKRLRPLTENLPKAMIKIGEKTLIEYSLDNLKKAGIKKVIVVLGYLDNMVREKIGNSYRGISISYVLNEEYSATGSAYSLYQIREMVNEDIVLAESDLLYEEKAVSALVASPYKNAILAAPISGSLDEVFICKDKTNNLSDLGKEIKNKDKACGELVGISKLSLPFLSKMFETIGQDYDKNERQYHYEEVISRLSKNYPVKCLMSKDLTWIEIDKESDLKRAKEIIFPKIISN